MTKQRCIICDEILTRDHKCTPEAEKEYEKSLWPKRERRRIPDRLQEYEDMTNDDDP